MLLSAVQLRPEILYHQSYKHVVCHFHTEMQLLENILKFCTRIGKGKESDPTDVSANTSVDTLPTRRPTHYRHVGQHTTNTFIEKLTFPNSYFVTSFSRKQEQRHKKGGKHES